jgi:DNA-nicking Smr family endonuclease
MRRNKRMLLVVTGKGRDGVGVLRQSLPLWLNAPSIRPFVLAFDVASRKDGGEGAFYVLLKRQRAHG